MTISGRVLGAATPREIVRVRGTVAVIVLAFLTLLPVGAEAQGRGNGRGAAAPAAPADATITLSVEFRTRIQQFYAARPPSGVEALPPGIRRNLARGRPLPPGIAKKVVPSDLLTVIVVPRGFELVEVGLDLFLVEVATNVIHDVLMDVIR